MLITYSTFVIPSAAEAIIVRESCSFPALGLSSHVGHFVYTLTRYRSRQLCAQQLSILISSLSSFEVNVDLLERYQNNGIRIVSYSERPVNAVVFDTTQCGSLYTPCAGHRLIDVYSN